jgi:hypothetical protein
LKDFYNNVISRFGPEFRTQYGWAAVHLKNPQPTFAALEQAAGTDHLRSHYRMASHNIHANVKGIVFKLGVPDYSDSKLLLTGRSNAGLADPGHGCAISLAQATVSLVTVSTTFDHIVVSKIVARLVDEIGKEFIAAHTQLERDEATVRLTEVSKP